MGQAASEEVIASYLKKNPVIVDCRTPREFAGGHIKGAINIPHHLIETHKDLPKDKDRHIIVYCRSGARSGTCEEMGKKLGYKNIINAGGFSSFQGIYREFKK